MTWAGWDAGSEVAAFVATHASESPPPQVELVVDAAGRIWAYEMLRHGWVCGEEFIAEEERLLLVAAGCGQLREIAV